MSISIGLCLITEYQPDRGTWAASVKQHYGDTDYSTFTAGGRTSDEALGSLVSQLVKAGMDEEMVFLNIESRSEGGR